MIGPPGHALENRRIKHHVDCAIVASKETSIGRVSHSQNPVHVPGQDSPPASRLKINVLVLRIACSPRVPVPQAPIEGEAAHPLIDVGDIEQVRDKVRGAIVGRSDHREEVGEVVGGGPGRPTLPVESVPREIVLAIGIPVDTQIGTRRGKPTGIIKFESEGHLAQVARTAVRIPRLSVFIGGLLQILRHAAKRGSVAVEPHVGGIQVGHPHLAGNPVGDLVAHPGRFFAAIARQSVDTVPGSQQQVVTGDCQGVIGLSSEGTSLAADTGIVNHAQVAMDEGAIAEGIVETTHQRRILTVAEPSVLGGGQPRVNMVERARRHWITPANIGSAHRRQPGVHRS